MISGKNGSIHARDLEENGVIALAVNDETVCFNCATDYELETCGPEHAQLDMYMAQAELAMQREGKHLTCDRCGERFFSDDTKDQEPTRKETTENPRKQGFNKRLLDLLNSK